MTTDYRSHAITQARLRTHIQNCKACGLADNTKPIPWAGVAWRPKLLLLGEAPGANEEREGVPFVGRAGQLLDNMLARIGLKRHHTMIMNTVCCRPPANRNPDWSEMVSCKHNRKAQIDLARTWVGVAMGKVAFNALIDDFLPIGPHKGRPFWAEDMIWVPTYHPAYLLRNPGATEEVVSHLNQALNIWKGKLDPPRPKTSRYTVQRGCVVIDHEDVVPPGKITAMGRAMFTKAEWGKIRYLSDPALDAVVNARTAFGATVVS